jgi:putative membrane protein
MIDWRHWHNEPWLVGGLVFLGWLWAVLAGPLRARLAGVGAPFPRRRAVTFYAALLIFYFAVGSPLDQVGERFLFSAHMLQHQLLIYPAAILFLAGLPPWMIDALLARPLPRALARFFTRPVVAAITFAVVIGTWHAPWLYESALQNKLLHVLEHLMFFGAALVYWWPLASPSRTLPALPYGAQMLYLLGATIAMTPTFAFITFSHDVLYPTYEFAPRLFPNFSPADDQLLAGTGMQLVGVIVSMTAFGWAFYRWYEAGERTAKTTAAQPGRTARGDA